MSSQLYSMSNRIRKRVSRMLTRRDRSGLQALQDQNAHLESSLSAETRLKLDLFSALGEARRQLSIRDAMIKAKEEELDEVRGQLIEILAVSDFSNHNQHQQLPVQQQQQPQHHQQTNNLHPSQHQQQQQQQQQQQHRLSNLSCQGQSSNTSNHLLGNHVALGSIPLGVSVSSNSNQNHHESRAQQQSPMSHSVHHQQGSGGGGGSLHSHIHPHPIHPPENLTFSSLIESQSPQF